MKQDTEAVSPVIGVILMVAITVVLAAVVFVLVQGLSQDKADATPVIQFQKGGNNLTVVSSPPGLNFSDLNVVGCSTVPAGTIEAGDKIAGCAGDVTIGYKPTNTLIYSTTF